MEPALRMSNITKLFPGTRALSQVSLEVRPGEIHGLVGGNGSGKSTLIKIAAGVHHAEPGGTIEVGGSAIPADTMTPDHARSAGVRVVHQDLGVFPEMTVAENLVLGNGYDVNRIGKVRWRRLHERAQALLEQFEIDAAPTTLLSRLSPANRSLVAIARACGASSEVGKGGLLILDEPTASLPAHEVTLLLAKLRAYADAGLAILYVSHRLDEIMEITQRVTALRDGRLVGTFETQALRESDLVELIVGTSMRSLPGPAVEPTASRSAALLEVHDLSVGCLRDVSFQVGEGEIVGVAGLLGAGRSTLLRALFGLRDHHGTVRLGGQDTDLRNVKRAMSSGVAYVPETRTEAAFFDLPISHNLAAARLPSFRRGVKLNHRRLQRAADTLSDEFGIKTATTHASLATLSGGNQQKVILARWLSRRPRLLLLDEPDHGVDVGARADIWAMIRNAAAEGMAVLVVTSDLEELARVVDRALVLVDGTISAELTGDDLTATNLTHHVYFGGHGSSAAAPDDPALTGIRHA